MPTIRTKSGGTRSKATGKSGTHTRGGSTRKSGHKVSTSSSGKETQIATGMTAIKQEQAANKKKLPEEMTHGAGTILQYDPYKSGSVENQLKIRQRYRDAANGNKFALREISEFEKTGDQTKIKGVTAKKVYNKQKLQAMKKAAAEEARRMKAYEYSKDKDGNIIPAMQSKNNRFGAQGIGRKDNTGKWVSYLSSRQVQAQNRAIKYANTGIHRNTNALDKRRITQARNAYLKQVPKSEQPAVYAHFVQQDRNAVLGRLLGYKNPVTNAQAAKVEAYLKKIEKYPKDKQAQLLATKFNKPGLLPDTVSAVKNVLDKSNRVLGRVTLPAIIEPHVQKLDKKLSENEKYRDVKQATRAKVEGNEVLSAGANVGKKCYIDLRDKPVNVAAELALLMGGAGVTGAAIHTGKGVMKAGIKKAATRAGAKKAGIVAAGASSRAVDAGMAAGIGKEFLSRDTEGKIMLIGELAIAGPAYAKGARFAETRLMGKAQASALIRDVGKLSARDPVKPAKPRTPAVKIGQAPKAKITPSAKPVRFKPKAAKPKKAAPPPPKPRKVNGHNIPLDQLVKLGEKEALEMAKMADAQKVNNWVLSDILKTPTRKTKGLSDQAILRIKHSALEIVEYKGQVYTVPKALTGGKRQLYLKRMYEGKPIKATPEEIATGKVSRRQLKEKISANEIIEARNAKDVRYHLNKLIQDESGQLMPGKSRQVPKARRNVKPRTSSTTQKGPFSRKGFINNIEVGAEVYNRVKFNYRTKPRTRLKNTEIEAVRRGLRKKIRPLERSQAKTRIMDFIGSCPLVTLLSVVKVTEKVAELQAQALAQATAAKNKAKAQGKTKSRVAPGRRSRTTPTPRPAPRDTRDKRKTPPKKTTGTTRPKNWKLPPSVPAFRLDKEKKRKLEAQGVIIVTSSRTVKNNLAGLASFF